MRHLDACHVREVLGCKMDDTALSARRVEQVTGLRLADRDDVFRSLRRQRRMGRDEERPLRHLDDRRDVVDRIERELVDARVHGVAACYQRQRVTVRRRLCTDFGAEGAARARPIVDDELLPRRFAELLRCDARDEVRAAARREWRDDANRFGRILLRCCCEGQRHRNRDGGRCMAVDA
jgi:hypothetical protein